VNVSETKVNIYNKLKENGFPITITHGSSDYNPVTDTTGTSIVYETFAIQTNFQDNGIEGVQLSDFKLLVPAIDNSGENILISPSDVVTRADGTQIDVYAIRKTAPTGIPIMFTLFCRE